MNTSSVNGSRDVLNSWKEIAAYLDRGIRTVQRWEAELNLPVHRPRGRGRSAVLAVRRELDQWIRNSPVIQPHSTDARSPLLLKEIRLVGRPANHLIAQHQELRMKTHRLRDELSLALGSVIDNLKKMSAPVDESETENSPEVDSPKQIKS